MTIYEAMETIEAGNSYEVIEFDGYIPYSKKKEIATQALAKASRYYNGATHIDTCAKKMYFDLLFVDAYTNIDIGMSIEEYDALMSSGIMDVVSHTREYERAYVIMEDILGDMRDDERIEMAVGHIVDIVDRNLTEMTDALVEMIGDLNINQLFPDGLKLEDILSMLKK